MAGVIEGYVTKQTGDFFPTNRTSEGSDQQSSESTSKFSTLVYVFNGLVKEPTSDEEVKLLKSKVRHVIGSNSYGYYRVGVVPGTYTLLLFVDGEFYLNHFNNGNYSSVTVKAGEKLKYDMVYDKDATW